MGRILKQYCPVYAIEAEKLYAQIVFNYLIGNGDAHLKNFSLPETPFGDHALSPCYDLLCTTVHLPNDTRTALELFDGNFATESFQTNGFYSRPHFLELADCYRMLKSRAKAFLDQCVTARPKIEDSSTAPFCLQKPNNDF